MQKIVTTFLAFLSFVVLSQAQCFEDRHSQSLIDSWASCDVSINPKADYGETHWIMYDFGSTYVLGQTSIWNFNYPEQTQNGIKDFHIDYSVNGTDWTYLGEFTIEEAPDTGFYEGSEGPDLSGIEARYILITAISNYGGLCVGFSEIKINTEGLVSNTKDELLEVTMEVSPNPFDNTFGFEIKEESTSQYNFSVMTLEGKEMTNGKINSLTPINFDTKAWSSGIYILTIEQGNKYKSQKLNCIK